METLNGTIEDLERIDRKTKKLLTMPTGLHPRSIVDRLYIPRTLSERGLISDWDFVEEKMLSVGQHIANSPERFSKTAEDDLQFEKAEYY